MQAHATFSQNSNSSCFPQRLSAFTWNPTRGNHLLDPADSPVKGVISRLGQPVQISITPSETPSYESRRNPES